MSYFSDLEEIFDQVGEPIAEFSTRADAAKFARLQQARAVESARLQVETARILRGYAQPQGRNFRFKH